MLPRIDRRQFLKAAAVTSGAIGVGVAWPRGHQTVARASGTNWCRLGGNWGFILNEEDKIGKTLLVHRIYKAWDEEFFTQDVLNSVEAGRRLVISVFPANRGGGTIRRWADLANGNYDGDIKAMATQLKDFGKTHWKKVGLAFHHEPENDRDGSLGDMHFGNEGDFKAAFTHFFSVLKSQGVKNMLRTIILFGTSYTSGKADSYWPGTSYVDRIGADCYNWYGTDGKPEAKWQSFKDLVTGTNTYALNKNKFAWICETATMEDPADPNRKAQWITDMGATLKTMPKIKMCIWFEGGINGWSLSEPPSGSEAALSAYTKLTNDSYFQ